LNPGDGQRRVDAKDGYAPFEVRSAYRADPSVEPHLGWYVAMAVIVLVALFVFVRCAMPVIR
jgi:hypothetical protein